MGRSGETKSNVQGIFAAPHQSHSGTTIMMAMPANAGDLRDDIAPTGKLRVAIGISPAGGAFWSIKTESGGYAGVPVDLGKEMAAQLGVPVEYVPFSNSRQITDAPAHGAWDVP